MLRICTVVAKRPAPMTPTLRRLCPEHPAQPEVWIERLPTPFIPGSLTACEKQKPT